MGNRSAMTLLASLVLLVSPSAYAGIATTKHNLSAGAPPENAIRATVETRVCRFCHVPHNASPAVPLWGHSQNSDGAYTIYTSATIQGSAGQPSGSSKQCLGCHDGAVGVGWLVASYTVPSGSVAMNQDRIPAGPTNLGTALSDDHPVSLVASGTDPEIVTNPGDARVKYDAAGRVQCTSCHDPHDNTNGKFLVKPNVAGDYGSQICLPCHLKPFWTDSAHRVSLDLYNGRLGNLTVANYGCESCHTPHGASQPTWLRVGASEEGICLLCHGSIGPGDDVSVIGTTPYGHQVRTYAGVHLPLGDGTGGTEPALPDATHVECTDCHDPHRTRIQPGFGARAKGTNVVDSTHGQSLFGLKVRRIQATSYTGAWSPPLFGPLSHVAYENEVCLRCHSTGSTVFTAGTERGSLDVHVNPNNLAHHALVAPGRLQETQMNNTFVSGSGITIDSTVYCSDCHDPHATNRFLLKQSSLADSLGNRFVCYNCHRVDVYGPGASSASLSRFARHSTVRHHDLAYLTTSSLVGFPADYPEELRSFSCLWCHGDLGAVKDGAYEPGGIHGANRGNTTHVKSDTGVHFLNGFMLKVTRSTNTATCGGYWDGSIGCHKHSAGDSGSQTYSWTW